MSAGSESAQSSDEPRRAAFVEFPTFDGRRLGALRYDPLTGVIPIGTLVYVHGKGGNCYSGVGRFVPTLRASDPLVHLSINMRCHDLGYTREDLPDAEFEAGGIKVDGGMWEDLSIGWKDIADAVRYARSTFGLPVVLVGHSSGGFYVADYTSRVSNEVAGRILLSPLLSNRRPFDRWFGGQDGFRSAARRAEDLVADGQGQSIIPVSGWFFGISARSLVQRAREDEGAGERLVKAGELPTLCIVGGKESRVEEWRALVAVPSSAQQRFVVVDGVGHYYGGAEAEVADAVVEFALETLAAGEPPDRESA